MLPFNESVWHQCANKRAGIGQSLQNLSFHLMILRCRSSTFTHHLLQVHCLVHLSFVVLCHIAALAKEKSGWSRRRCPHVDTCPSHPQHLALDIWEWGVELWWLATALVLALTWSQKCLRCIATGPNDPKTWNLPPNKHKLLSQLPSLWCRELFPDISKLYMSGWLFK